MSYPNGLSRSGTALAVLVLLAASALAGCGKHQAPGAVGANEEVSVLTNTPRDGAVADAVRRIYAYPVQVGPTQANGTDPAFLLDFVPFSQFKNHQYVKNQIFAVDLSGADDLARAVPGMLGDAGKDRIRAKEPFMLLARDRWATGQTSLFAVAWSREGLLRLFTGADSTRLRREYEQASVAGLTKTMFTLGEETDLENQVARQYGWTLRLLDGFYAAQDVKGDFVKFNAADPVRLILVHWIDDPGLALDAGTWDPILTRVLEVYNDGDFFMPGLTDTARVSFQDQPALRWDGIWQNEKYTIGGPFRAFAFHRGQRSYLLVGQVFAPGQDKVPMLRQVEAMLTTFRVVE